MKKTKILLFSLLAATALSAAPAGKKTAPQKGKKVTAKTPDPSRARATLQTDMGDITIRFFPDKAPHHVQNFLELASKGIYDGVLFHRVIPGFMAQTGDPLTKDDKTPRESMGTGGYQPPAGEKAGAGFQMTNIQAGGARGAVRNVQAEFNDVSHKRGIVSMARASDPNSASSQFFIVVKDSTFLDRQYTAFGEVVSGMEVADKIVASPRDERDNPKSPVHIKKVVVSEAEPGK